MLASGIISELYRGITNQTLAAVLRLLRVQAALDARLPATLGSTHGLALNEVLLMNRYQSPFGRMRRVDLAAALVMSQSSVPRGRCP